MARELNIKLCNVFKDFSSVVVEKIGIFFSNVEIESENDRQGKSSNERKVSIWFTVHYSRFRIQRMVQYSGYYSKYDLQLLVHYSGYYAKYDLLFLVQASGYYSKVTRVLFRVWFSIQGIIQNTTCSLWFRIQRIIQNTTCSVWFIIQDIIKKWPGYYSGYGSVYRVLFKI